MLKKLYFVLFIIMIFIVGCTKKEAPKEVAVHTDTTVSDIVGEVIKNQFVVEEKDGIVNIYIHDADVKNGSKNQILKDSAKIFAELSKLKTVKTPAISWSAPLDSVDSDEKSTEVLNIYFSEEDFRKVDWALYSQLNLESIASHYQQHELLGD
ncbi:hypothetical protein [Lysinibacillus piscis]|uniref:Uncharacterized protein n=1 Tax=Lysinibacillus piscis TaxID=2518931 RepID=A0ABQ5NJ93_9BACI|nr:hypothetical protein [Lysinibacillus sp. KH24]GLC88099.1 hypothetical protein LYSBPC_12260 [Lysinibacillus sp. KH24]